MNKTIKGRGASFNPPNRFEELHVELIEDDDLSRDDLATKKTPTRFYIDTSKSILAKNDSPDLGFAYSINPYRGCEHGCIYCYARPSHEYLGFSSGIDFETKIMVKLDAAKLLSTALSDMKWKPQLVAMSGNTDCYQPAERKLELTRECLKTFLEFRNPVSIITKNALVLRDLDILKQMSEFGIISVTISITTLDNRLARVMEPRTSSPLKRLETVKILSENGVRVGVLVAPVIPGLNDEEIPALLREASFHGARSAGYVILRLPYAIKDLFKDWLERTIPDRAEKILSGIRSVRQGKLNDSEFGKRMRGRGPVADAIKQLFATYYRRYFQNTQSPPLSTGHFLRRSHHQHQLF